MNPINTFGTRFLSSAVLAATVGLWSAATPAETDAVFPTSSSATIERHLAYNAKRWPVYRNVHRQRQPERAEFAGLEKKSEAVNGMQAAKPGSPGRHRRTPYTRKH